MWWRKYHKIVNEDDRIVFFSYTGNTLQERTKERKKWRRNYHKWMQPRSRHVQRDGSRRNGDVARARRAPLLMQVHLMSCHGRRGRRWSHRRDDGTTTARSHHFVALLLWQLLLCPARLLLLLLDGIWKCEAELVPESVLSPLQVRIGLEI